MVAGGTANISNSTFNNNGLHVEVSKSGRATCTSCEFQNSSSDSGVHVLEAVGTFKSCTFAQSRSVAILAEGEINVSESTIKDSRRAAVLFGNHSSGVLRDTTLTNNGECCVLCASGSPSILSNKIEGGAGTKFGIYICNGTEPAIEGNEFHGNAYANIWKE